jgi:hypothetical protein
MKSLLKYLGPIILLIGTILLVIYYFTAPSANTLLVVSGAVLVAGLIIHVIVNKLTE